MKKTLAILIFLSAISLQAQTSRITVALGGGFTANQAKGMKTEVSIPLATLNFGYSILGSVKTDDVKLGLRTGLGITYSRFKNRLAIDETFTNTDYLGHEMNYTVKSNNKTLFKQQNLYLELPLLFSTVVKGFYVNVGPKFFLPLWNKYNQVIYKPEISAFYPDYGVTVVNDVVTGLLTNDQRKTSGKADAPEFMIGFSVEFGHVWQLKKTKNSLGLDLFVDYIPWNFGGKLDDNDRNVIEVAPIVNDCEQPKAAVTVNPINKCNNFKYQTINFGVRLVYTFDIEHKAK